MNIEDRTNDSNPSTTEKVDDSVRLSQGVHVPRVFHDELFQRVAAHVPRLQFGREYAIHELVEAGYWASIWSRQWQAARCVPDLVRGGKLPALTLLGCERCSKLRYVRNR